MLTLINVISSPEGVFSATSAVGLAFGGVFVTVALIFLLSVKEIVSASEYYSKNVENVLNTPILPMLFVFFAIVIFKTLEVLYP